MDAAQNEESELLQELRGLRRQLKTLELLLTHLNVLRKAHIVITGYQNGTVADGVVLNEAVC